MKSSKNDEIVSTFKEWFNGSDQALSLINCENYILYLLLCKQLSADNYQMIIKATV